MGAKQVSLSRQRSRARRLALQALYQWQITGDAGADILSQFRADPEKTGADSEYFSEILLEVITRAAELQAVLAPLLDRAVEQLDPIERAIMLVGVYELSQRPDVPYRVVINEAVELAKRFGAEDGHRYINAVLDKAAAELRASEYRTEPAGGS